MPPKRKKGEPPVKKGSSGRTKYTARKTSAPSPPKQAPKRSTNRGKKIDTKNQLQFTQLQKAEDAASSSSVNHETDFNTDIKTTKNLIESLRKEHKLLWGKTDKETLEYICTSVFADELLKSPHLCTDMSKDDLKRLHNDFSADQ